MELLKRDRLNISVHKTERFVIKKENERIVLHLYI